MPSYNSGDKNCYHFINRLLNRCDPNLFELWNNVRGLKVKHHISKDYSRKKCSKHWKTAFKSIISRGRSNISDSEMQLVDLLLNICQHPKEFLYDSKGKPTIHFRTQAEEEFVKKCKDVIYPTMIIMMQNHLPSSAKMDRNTTELDSVEANQNQNLAQLSTIDDEIFVEDGDEKLSDSTEAMNRVTGIEVENQRELERLREELAAERQKSELLEAENAALRNQLEINYGWQTFYPQPNEDRKFLTSFD